MLASYLGEVEHLSNVRCDVDYISSNHSGCYTSEWVEDFQRRMLDSRDALEPQEEDNTIISGEEILEILDEVGREYFDRE